MVVKMIFQCFKSSDDLLNAFNIKTDNPNGNLNRTDVQRLLPALLNVKFNDGCRKTEGRITWKSTENVLFVVSYYFMFLLF